MKILYEDMSVLTDAEAEAALEFSKGQVVRSATTSPVFETKNFTQRQLHKRFIEAVMEVNTI